MIFADFDSHEKIIIQAKIPAIVMKMASNDPDWQVRSKALQCLQEIVCKEAFWCHLVMFQNIYVSIGVNRKPHVLLLLFLSFVSYCH